MPDDNRALGPPDIHEMLAASASEHGDAHALIDPGQEHLTYADLFQRVTLLAGHLASKGVSRQQERDARVAIALPNGIMMSLALLAVPVVGVAVPFNPAYTRAEFEAYFKQAGVGRLLTDAKLVPAAVEAAAALGIDVIEASSTSEPAGEALDPPSPDDIAILLLTSGTTGRGKLVPLTHRNLCSGAAQVAQSVDLTPADRVLSMWELFHIGGIVDLLLAPLISGGAVICAGSFNAERFFALLRSEGPTWFQGVPTSLRELLNYREAQMVTVEGSSLRFLRSVAAALPPAQMVALEGAFNVPVIQTFGMTEASPLITSTRLPPAERKSGSTGRSCGTELSVMDAKGQALPSGEIGELAIRGDNVFAGYLDNPQVNAQVIQNGWFYTGDLGCLDADNDLFLTGRIKDMINRGGEKIAPQEVEDVLLKHPFVAEAVAFSAAHPTLGEEVCAAVVPRPGRVISSTDLKAFASSELAAFKVPKDYVILDNLPKSQVGKVLRREVADAYAENQKTERSDAAPRDTTERMLADLWASELDLPAVNLDDDFSQIGGDSLSSVRIVLAVQKRTGLTIPDAALDRLTTVRSMAAFLRKLGYSPDKAPRPVGKNERSDALLAEIANDMLSRDTLGDDILWRCATQLEFKKVHNTVENISTPAELRRLLKVGGFKLPLETLRQPLVAASLLMKRRKLKRDVERMLLAGKDVMSWQRQSLSDNADLFCAPYNEPAAKTLVVGFSGRALSLMSPTYRLLCTLDPHMVDLMVIRDPSRKHYFFGVPGIGDTLEAAARWLADWAEKAGYRRVVALGTSSGALPSICVSVMNGWSRVLAVGTPPSSGHPHLTELLAACAKVHGQNQVTEVILSYAGQNQHDIAGAGELKTLMPDAAPAPDNRFIGHNLIHQLHMKGELKDYFVTNLLQD